VIPGGSLAAGDRIEVRFDIEHQGSAGAYSFEVHWGTTTVLHRDATAGDSQGTGRAISPCGSEVRSRANQSWDTALPFATGVGTAADDYFTNGITIDSQALAASGDTVTLRNFSVVRVP